MIGEKSSLYQDIIRELTLYENPQDDTEVYNASNWAEVFYSLLNDVVKKVADGSLIISDNTIKEVHEESCADLSELANALLVKKDGILDRLRYCNIPSVTSVTQNVESVLGCTADTKYDGHNTIMVDANYNKLQLRYKFDVEPRGEWLFIKDISVA